MRSLRDLVVVGWIMGGTAALGSGGGCGEPFGTGGSAGATTSSGSTATETGGAGTTTGTGGTGTTTGTGGTGTTSGSTTGTAGSGGTGTVSGHPHPLYPPLDLDTLPGAHGGAVGVYEPPTLPAVTHTVTITTTGFQARTDIIQACQSPGAEVIVPDAAGSIGILDLGHAVDCDITLGAAVIVQFVYVGHLPGPQVAPAHRVRIRGGQIGSVMVDPGSTDIVFDGVIVNNGVVSPAQRSGTGIYLMSNGQEIVNRFAFVNSILRMVATEPDANGNTDGCAYLASRARNVFFANDNIVTGGNRNAWGFRLSGADNFIIADSAVRVSFHKLIRMNDAPVDYVYVKGGTWMREATLTAMGMSLNDTFAQLGDLGTDNVFIHDPEVWLSSSQPPSFGASIGAGQIGKTWEVRRIGWHARAASVVSDALLMGLQDGCAPGATCDYGVGTHTYQYDASIAFPASPWRDLPGIAADDPDDQPVEG